MRNLWYGSIYFSSYRQLFLLRREMCLKDLEHGQKADEPEDTTKKAGETSEEQLPKLPGSTTTVHVQTEVFPHPMARESSPRRDGHINVLSGPGSTNHISVDKLPRPETTASEWVCSLHASTTDQAINSVKL